MSAMRPFKFHLGAAWSRRALLGGALAIAFANLLPLALVAKQALSPERESFAWPPLWWPGVLTLDNFREAADVVPLGDGLLMSVGVATFTVLSTMALALPAAWASRRHSTGRALDGLLVAIRLLPSIALAIPLAALFVAFGLYNRPSGVGLWLAHTLLGLPFAYFVLRTGVSDLPVSVGEAARLDGAGPTSFFLHIALPLLRPSLGAAAMLVFLLSWDEFAFALLLQVTNRPLPPLLYYLSAFGHPGLASAVAVIMLLPALVLVLLLEPALRSGLLSGSQR